MFRMVFKISVRNLLKNKLYSIINVAGLALGFTAFILVRLFLTMPMQEERYRRIDEKIPRAENRIYKIQEKGIH
jgi:putative ABC transport system permease protein